MEFGDMANPESLVAKRISRFYHPILRRASQRGIRGEFQQILSPLIIFEGID
jgi:hypothetical protein